MRLWHEKLISKLPRQQLLGQHRECLGISSPCSYLRYLNKGILNALETATWDKDRPVLKKFRRQRKVSSKIASSILI